MGVVGDMVRDAAEAVDAEFSRFRRTPPVVFRRNEFLAWQRAGLLNDLEPPKVDMAMIERAARGGLPHPNVLLHALVLSESRRFA